MFNLIKDDFDENMDDIMNSINKMLENDVENEKTEEVFCVLILMPKVLHTFEQMNTVMEELEMVSEELAEADIAGMLDNVDT